MNAFVVEGTADEQHLKTLYPDLYCVVTHGTRMNNRVKSLIEKALQECDQVFLLSDPDEAGDALAHMVMRFFPTVVRIPLNPERCKVLNARGNRYSYGVEHADLEYLKTVLQAYVK